MNETLKTILNRRSYRAYKPEPVKESDLQSILEAGKFAPSGMNSQPWHFSVIRSQALLNQINEAVKEGLAKSGNPQMAARAKDEKFSIFYHAPALIVISAKSGDWAIEDAALAAENLMLAAYAEGLGSCWIGFAQRWLETDEGKRSISVAAGFRPIAPIIVGHPSMVMSAVPRNPARIRWIG